ncbi:uncharacterized protein LOC113654382 isoform X1 [Tachysurus ichikawai]
MKKLWRRKNKTDVAKITSFCVQQLESSGCVDCENFKTGTNYTFKPAIPGVIELGDWRLNGNIVVEWEGCVDCENFKTGTNYTFKPAIPGVIELGDWRLNGNLVVEWEGKSETIWYRLKDRATLNTDNGDLTVWLKKEDSGVFKALFQVQGVLKSFERTIKVIDPVTKPKVTCEQNDQDITLKCSVDAPVQALFTWFGPDGFSHVGDSVQITRKQNDDSIYYCSAKNEVSVMSAEFKPKDCNLITKVSKD